MKMRRALRSAQLVFRGGAGPVVRAGACCATAGGVAVAGGSRLPRSARWAAWRPPRGRSRRRGRCCRRRTSHVLRSSNHGIGGRNEGGRCSSRHPSKTPEGPIPAQWRGHRKPEIANHGPSGAYGVSCRVRTERPLSYASTRRCRVAVRFTPSAGAELVPPSMQVQDGPARFGIARHWRAACPGRRGARGVCDFRYMLRRGNNPVNGLTCNLCGICKGSGRNRQFPNPRCGNAIRYTAFGFDSDSDAMQTARDVDET